MFPAVTFPNRLCMLLPICFDPDLLFEALKIRRIDAAPRAIDLLGSIREKNTAADLANAAPDHPALFCAQNDQSAIHNCLSQSQIVLVPRAVEKQSASRVCAKHSEHLGFRKECEVIPPALGRALKNQFHLIDDTLKSLRLDADGFS